METPSIHPAAKALAAEHNRGALSRREFLARATSLGVTTAAAYGLIGAALPSKAQAQPAQGGTLRIQSSVHALKDPRNYDWPEMANFSRGWLEFLVEYQRDGSFMPMLLESWEVNEDATQYILHVRPGVTWNDGTPFTAADVAFNITRWCDQTVEGNSMASRMATLVDPETKQARDGAIVATDDLTVTLTLPAPDITLIAGFSDYPAGIVPQDFSGDPMADRKGTGPFIPTELEVGVRAVMVRNTDHTWWGTEVFGGPYLDQVEYIDFGTDSVTHFTAAEADEIDMVYESLGEFADLMDDIGWQRSESLTANTVVIRTNQNAEVDGIKPYADARVRRALAMAVQNEVVLELGYGGHGTIAENHHVCPIHPEYAQLPAPVYDPEGAVALMAEAGLADFEHELISIDDNWRRDTSDAVAAQLRDAGIKVKRTVIPGNTFWNDWDKYPFSATDWAQRPLGVQVLALAYRSGEAWNETGFANAEFDETLKQAMAIADADTRRKLMAKLEQIMRDEGVVIQPYWRSTYRHARPGVIGGEQHPTYEIHPSMLAFEA
ncbi:ABC transporter substrate-binding protein [Mameliella alba]|nr:ABC transporter substrate-binding protein [Antarctobacter heliothermus]MBY6146636.1 ABC transporter substrate-binding protein [Mameliella alba]MCA0957186.1 ABC transporter substrate-binding protein [Mameliella alba]